jgi:hypothetical protein
VVVATGFKLSSDVAEGIMGKEFMAKVGQVGELDEEKERITVSFKLLWILSILLIDLGFSGGGLRLSRDSGI